MRSVLLRGESSVHPTSDVFGCASATKVASIHEIALTYPSAIVRSTMHIPTHFLSSWALANGPKFTAKERFFCLLVGTLPDLDGIGIVASQEAYEAYHHVVAHNLLAGLALCGSLALASQRKRFALLSNIGTPPCAGIPGKL